MTPLDVEPHAADSPPERSPRAAHRAMAALGLPAATPRRHLLAIALAMTLAVSIGACGFAAWDREDATSTPAASMAAERDEAHGALVAALEILLSSDHREAPKTLDDWRAVTTGKLHARLNKERKALVRQLRKNEELSRATVVDSGLASWDGSAGAARLLAILELDTRNKSGKSESSLIRYLALAQHVEGKWRLSAVQQMGESS